MKSNKILLGCSLLFILTSCHVANIFAARYYRLLEHERKIFLGFKGIDPNAAEQYINLESVAERTKFYEEFWQNREASERLVFEERVETAFSRFGKHAPISDDRIPIYVKYGEPTKREEIWPQKQIALRIRESVKPAEVWTYKKEGIIFDFVRFTRAYTLIAESEFGEQVKIPYLIEVADDTLLDIQSTGLLDFNVTTGRYRQKKNLTRLEVYITVNVEDTTGLSFYRLVKVFDDQDSLLREKSNILIPYEGTQGTFCDEVNFWVEPDEYRLEITVIDVKNLLVGKEIMWVNLLDYQDDAKKISDLVPARLIDNNFSHEKFNKPVGRVIPVTKAQFPIYYPFYFYAEVYNLETKNGLHQLKMTYEVTNKTKMKREIVDVLIKDQIEAGDIAYLATHYHPMDLEPGSYLITLRAIDLISGEERTAVCEFELKQKE